MTTTPAQRQKIVHHTSADEPSPEMIEAALERCQFRRTRTRVGGFYIPEPMPKELDGLVLEHKSRSELPEGGCIICVDLTPEGTPIALKEGAIVRRIGADAVKGLAWGHDQEAEAELRAKGMDDFFGLEVIPPIVMQENQSYNKAISVLCDLTLKKKIEFRLYRQHCGIKVEGQGV